LPLVGTGLPGRYGSARRLALPGHTIQTRTPFSDARGDNPTLTAPLLQQGQPESLTLQLLPPGPSLSTSFPFRQLCSLAPRKTLRQPIASGHCPTPPHTSARPPARQPSTASPLHICVGLSPAKRSYISAQPRRRLSPPAPRLAQSPCRRAAAAAPSSLAATAAASPLQQCSRRPLQLLSAPRLNNILSVARPASAANSTDCTVNAALATHT
jgi:hypothetical protein